MYINRLIVVFSLALFFLSPAIFSWALENRLQWFRPFLAAFILILITFWFSRSKDLDDL